jgi:alpha-tubulin suppressor-like RCC1 family protein
MENGEVRCWGPNTWGQLGYGHTNTIGDDELPSSVAPVNLGGKAIHIAVGYGHTCAQMQDGALRCWGHNASGALGYGHTDHIGDEPGEMPPPPVQFR